MKRSITSSIIAAVAALAALALAGCGTGVESQTAHEVAVVPGYNITGAGELVGVRNALLAYPGPDGYKAGSDATVEMRLFNNTINPVQVVIKSDDGTVKTDATITIPSQGMISPAIQLTGLKNAVTSEKPVHVEVEFVGVEKFDVPLNIVPPTAPSA